MFDVLIEQFQLFNLKLPVIGTCAAGHSYSVLMKTESQEKKSFLL